MPETTTDINSLLKRLGIIKNLIAIQDIDDIAYQSRKLRKIIESEPEQDLSVEISNILSLIDNKAYSDAMQIITDLLQHYNSVITWADPEIQGLLAEIKELTAQIALLESELTDIEKTIHEFEVKHTEILGVIILKMLDLKKRIAAKKVEERPNDEKVREKYDESKTDEQQYKGSYEEIKKNPIQQLSNDEELELKTLFRKISKLTHPDCVNKKFEKQAAEIFMKAKKAKSNNDLHILRQIHEYLASATPFTLKQETINEKIALKHEVRNLRSVIEQLLWKIADSKQSVAYQTITKIDNWDKYFADIKDKLQTESENLEKQYNEQR